MADKVIEYKHLTWQEIAWMIDITIAEMHRNNYVPSYIVPIGYGGIIPAAMFTYRYCKTRHVPLPMLPPVLCTSYDSDNRRSEVRSVWPREVGSHIDTEVTLFIDDICDSGSTIRHIKQTMPKSKFFCLVTKDDDTPDWYATYDSAPVWWVFPWEKG